MKKTFKKIASLCVTAYAKRIYEQAVFLADDCHKKDGDMYFVITNPQNNKKLMCINTKQFLDIRHKLNIPSKELPIQMLKNQCWYRTPNKNGKDCLGPRDLTVRKLAFCRELLTKAHLI